MNQTIIFAVTVILIIASGVVYYRYLAGKSNGVLPELTRFCLIFLVTFVGSAVLVGDIMYLWFYRFILGVASGIAAVIGMRKARRMAKGNK